MRSIHCCNDNPYYLYLYLFLIIISVRCIISEVINEKNCLSSKYNPEEIEWMKCSTISNGIEVCINEKGIYTYNSVLSKILYSYNFTSLTISIRSNSDLAFCKITEFKVNDIKNNIILCFVNKMYLFVLSYKGEFIFLSKFEPSIEAQSNFNFKLYNYDSLKSEYKYIISYINGFDLNILYYSINIKDNSNIYINKTKFTLTNGGGCPCEILVDNSQQHLLTCFGALNNKFLALSFLPEENFKFSQKASLNISEAEVTNIKNVKSFSYDKINSLVCITTNSQSLCVAYNIVDDNFSSTIFSLTGCVDNIYGINLYYFEKNEEFIFSCIGNQNYFKMISITKDFNYIEDKNKFQYYKFEDCSTPQVFSILYINPFKIYSIIISIQCTGNLYPLRNYLLIENITTCNNIVNDINEGNYIEDEVINYKDEQIKETNKIIETSKLPEKSIPTQIIESSLIKLPNESTDFYQRTASDEGAQAAQNMQTSVIIKSNEITEIETNENISSNKIEETNKIKESNIISNSDEKSSSNINIKSDKNLKSDEIMISSQITDSNINNSSQTIDNSDRIISDKIIEINNISESNRNSEYIFSTHITEFVEKKESNQIDISNKITEYSTISDNANETEKPILTQIFHSTDIKDSLELTEKITDELSNNFESSEINKLTQITFSSKIIESSEIIDTTSIEISRNSEKAKITEKTEYTEKEMTDLGIKCDEKCSKCDEKSNNMNLCIECNKKNKYYEIKSNDLNNKLNEGYKECYNENNKPSNYFLNEIEGVYEPCYYTCGSCKISGNSNEHNCLTCSNNYVFDDKKINNCIIKCKYYYYYTNYGEYKCTIDNQCPEEASLLISELSKCTNNCQNDKYYQYNGECVSKCPKNTERKENYICRIKESDDCSYSLKELFLYNEIQKDNIENIVKNYAKEFSYTSNHISNYISNEYSIIIYKNSECIQKLGLDLPKIDFKECYQIVQDHYSIEDDLIIALIDNYYYNEDDGVKNPVTTYAFFHPETGENLNANEICGDIKIIVEEKISSIMDDTANALFFSEQNVDIFNLSNEFYSDTCFHFESPFKKDVVIKDRIQTFFPNVTLCDSGCSYKGLNFTSFTAICECIFRDLLDKNFLNDNFLFDNIIVSGMLNQIYESFRIVNLKVMLCYNTIFDPKYLSKCIGGFLILFLFILEILCIILYSTVGIKETIGFIFKVSEIFKDSNQFKLNEDLTEQTEVFALSPPKKKSLIIQDKNDLSQRTSCSLNRRQSNKIKIITQEKVKNLMNRKIKKRKSKKEEKTMKNLNININMTNVKVTNVHPKNKSRSIMLMNSNILNDRKKGNRKFSRIPSKLLRNKRKVKSSRIVTFFINKKSEKNEILEKSNSMSHFKENFDINFYLLTPVEEMVYDDAIQKEKKIFFGYFIERIKSQHLLVNSFFILDNIRPKSIKILLFLTQMDLYLLFNAMLYNEDYISEIFHSENESFYDIVKRSINHYIYINFVGKITKCIMNLFFIKEKKYIRILKRAKNITELNGELYLFTQKLRRGYKYFIIISICFIIISWYYISCFNNVYQYIKKEWIISSFCFFSLTLLLNALAAFLETIFRYLSFKIENDQIYRMSLYFRMFE